MASHEAKEMLQHPADEGNYLIDYALKLAANMSARILVISRPEKTDLNSYLEKRNINFITHVPSEKEEWMDTVLASSECWDEDNILLLPDTRFDPNFEILKTMEKQLSLGSSLSIALHKVTDPKNWCTLLNGVYGEKYLFEKSELSNSEYAFGILGFKYKEGLKLFKALSQERNYTIPRDTQYLFLDYFEDVTRTKW